MVATKSTNSILTLDRAIRAAETAAGDIGDLDASAITLAYHAQKLEDVSRELKVLRELMGVGSNFAVVLEYLPGIIEKAEEAGFDRSWYPGEWDFFVGHAKALTEWAG